MADEQQDKHAGATARAAGSGWKRWLPFRRAGEQADGRTHDRGKLPPDATPERETAEERRAGGLGTFQGVYRPTVLTILGVMMYLREGWVVGEAGLLGAVLLILLTFVITGTAALSLSSITTNIHVGAGGVFSIISQSLGLESGGSIGVPFYMGQALSAALYIYGFTEAWLYIFPEHSSWLVAYSIFVVVLATTLASTRLAFRMQGVVLVVILVSLASIVAGAFAPGDTPLQRPQLWGAFEEGGFWVLFAIFFPAGTGINVGASMSGALEKPRVSIPRGTLAAVGTALVVYLGMAVWYSVVAPPEVLRANRLVVVDEAAVGGLVLAGILASTFTAALSSMVASPRVLQALADQNVVPGKRFLSRLTPAGDPRNAALATGVLVAAALLLGSLDAVAVLITMFFLLTYLTINIVVAIEQSLGMVSFRPTFRVPLWVPIVGMVSCFGALFVISPGFALVALAIVVALYIYLVTRQLEAPWQTVRSSIYVALADWASKHIARSPEEANERSWKPDLLVPATARSQIDGTFRFLSALVAPRGSLKIVGVRTPGEAAGDAPSAEKPSAENPSSERFSSEKSPAAIQAAHGPARDLDALHAIRGSFQAEGLFATSVVIDAPSLLQGTRMSVSVMRGSAFRPNVLFGLAHRYDQATIQGFVDLAAEHQMGLALLFEHPEASLGQERRVNVWASDQSPAWELGLRLANLDLSVLLGYQVVRNWQGRLRLLTVCREEGEMPNARAYLQRLIEDARMPRTSRTWVAQGDFLEKIGRAPEADLSVLGLPRHVRRGFLEEVVQQTGGSCLFVRDSGRESALA